MAKKLAFSGVSGKAGNGMGLNGILLVLAD
jgi:hypothetical protein